jgi:hypothetical protein
MAKGLGLRDVLPQSETVEINGKKVPVYGISGGRIGILLNRFPALEKLFDSTVSSDEKTVVLKKFAPPAIAPVVAAALGWITDDEEADREAERDADRLSIEVQIEILEKTRGLTFKQGLGPFVRLLSSMMGGTVDDVAGKASFTRSQKPQKPSEPPPTQASGT